MFRPAFDGQTCSLGYQVVDWIEAYACHGPGDVQGDPITFDDETMDFIVAAYELDPKTGRRKKSKVVYSAPKGRAKSETAGLIAVAEALGSALVDQQGQVPDLAPAFDRLEVDPGEREAVDRLERDLDDQLERAATRAFRDSFLIGAGLALAALLTLVPVRRRRAS